MTVDSKGHGLFIVDNSVSGWTRLDPFAEVWDDLQHLLGKPRSRRGFIRDRSGRERRRPVLPTGPVHSGPASPVTATCPPSASRQSRPAGCQRLRAPNSEAVTGYPALDADSGRPAADDSADGVDRQPAPNAAKQRPVLVPGRLKPSVDPGDGRCPEIQHGALAFLIGFRLADKQPSGAVRFRLHVLNIERGNLGHPQQSIGCNRQQGGVAKAGDGPAVVCGDRGRGVDFAEAHPVDLAPAPALAFASQAGQHPVGCRTDRRGEALQPATELDGRDRH